MSKTWDKTKPSKLLRFPNKDYRAEVIDEYVQDSGYAGVVVFTCGNAARALRKANYAPGVPQHTPLEVVEVGPQGVLKTDHWWTPAEIHKTWPNLFDATSGHLPYPLMVDIAEVFKTYLGELDPATVYLAPTGSGETIICLQIAYPACTFVAVYDNSNQATTRDNDAPLNSVVDGQFAVEYWHNQLDLR